MSLSDIALIIWIGLLVGVLLVQQYDVMRGRY